MIKIIGGLLLQGLAVFFFNISADNRDVIISCATSLGAAVLVLYGLRDFFLSDLIDHLKAIASKPGARTE